MSEAEDVWERSVLVEQLPTTMTPDVLELLFEDFEETGGGAIDQMSLDDGGTATIVFEEPAVAERVLGRSQEVDGIPVVVKRPPKPQPEVPDQPEVSSSVKVFGLQAHIKPKLLDLFFKNKQKSGGGPIASIDVDEKEKTAIVTFQSAEDAHSVAEKGLHTIGGCELVVEMATTSASTPEHSESRSVTTPTDPEGHLGANHSMQQSPGSVESQAARSNAQSPKSSQESDTAKQGSRASSSPTTQRIDDRSLQGSLSDHTKPGNSTNTNTPRSTPERRQGEPQDTYTEGHETQGPRATESDDIGGWQNVVDVVGIPVGIHRQMVFILFSSKSESGGGEIKELNYDTNTGRARIRFTHKKDADEVLRRGKIGLQDTFVTVQKPTNPTSGPASKTHPSGSPYPNDRSRKEEKLQEQHHGQVASVTDQDNSNDVSQSNVAVLIRGVTKKCSPQVLSLFFENKKASGGGPLVTIDFNPEGDSARVIFKNPEDAHEVVRRRNFKCEGTLTAEWLQSSTFRNTPVNVSEAAHQRQTTGPGDQEISHQIDDTEIVVQIRGIPKQWPEQFISLFFENKKKSGGGKIKRLDFNPGEGSARIVFKAAEDAHEVARRKTFSYQDATLTAEILSFSSPRLRPVGGPSVPEPQTGRRPKLCTVQVSGIPPSSSGDYLKLFFENKRVSGGGPVRHFDYTQDSGTAVVEFEHAEDAERLVQTCPPFNGVSIRCDVLDARASNEKPFALVVRDLDPKVSEQTLQLFFDSERASGGNGVENVEFDAEQRTAVVTFHRGEVVERVLSRQPLTLEKKKIVLSRLNPAPLVPYVANNVENKSMIVQGIPTKCTKDELVTFLEKHSQNQVSNVVFGIKVPYVTLVVFKRNLDFEHVQRMCARYPLRGVMLSVQQVETLDSIQVSGVEDMSLQSLELYFESERSGGGPIRKVEECRKQDCLVIKFCEPSTFHRVMKKSPHVFEKHEMLVRPFIPGLGILPPGHTTSAPPVLIPPPVLRSDINPNIVHFWLNSEENRKAIEQGLFGLHCRVVWPDKVDGNLKLECSLKENDPKLHTLPDGWTENVNGRFSRIADNYEATEMGIKPQCFQPIVAKLKEVKSPDVIILGASREKCFIRLAGKKHAVAEMVDAIRKQEEKIETGLKHETLKIGKPTMSGQKFKLMQLYDQPDRIRQKYPDIQVEFCGKDGTATLKGPRENLKPAKLDIVKFTAGITSRVLTVSNNMLRFLQSEEIASLIDGRLKQAGARVIWETGDAITITGATGQECDKGKTLLKNMIRESTIPLENMDTRFFMEATWTNFKEQTESNKPVRLFVANNEREQSHLCIVGFSDEVDSVEEQAKDYIEQNSIMKETVQVDPGTATLLLSYLNTELIEMRRSRRGFQVECSADRSNSAIEFCGNPESMKAAKNKLQNARQLMVSKTHSLSEPGMQKAFSGERAKLFCLGMERKHSVVVNLVEKGGATKPRSRGAEASSWRGNAEGQETLVRNLPFKETRNPNVIQTQNIRITLRKGSIESEQTAVVVNPLDRDLDLKKTATSRALLKAAGGQLEDEFKRNVEKSEVKPGSIIETKGWNLSSWAVYHGVLVGWDSPGDQAEQVMQELLQKCFQTAEDNRIPSMSLPPAGTGKLGYPAEKVVQIILAEIASFGSKRPAHLTDIHIIVHPKDVKKQEIFERAFCSAVGKNEPSQRGNGTHVDRDTSSSFAGSAGDGDENKFKVGSISLIIKTGDITRERTDAIVNSSNPKLDLSRGAVQRAIARAGGDDVERECREKTVRNGIAVTTAGKMDAKKIIHLAPSSRDRDGLLWQKLVKKALDEAEKMGLKTVAFPAVGTGSGHQDVGDVAKAMVEGLAYFETNTKPKSVKVVNFTIFQKEMVNTFKDAAKRFSKGGGQKGRSPVGSASVESGALAREIELQIYALSEAIIQDVKREIAEYAEESMITGEIGDSSIKKLTDKQKKDIRTFASSRGVEVDFETKRLGFGRNSASIRGHADDVMLVKDHISKILKDIQKAKHEKETGKVMSRQVQWEFQDPQGPFKAYPDEINLKIENAFESKKATVEWNKGSKRMKITFNDMEGEVIGDPGKKVSVRRMEQGGIGPPAHWLPMNPNEPYKLVPLATTDKDYAAIVADFQKTMGPRTIKKIERVQNPIIYIRYMTHKAQMDKHNPPGTVNEMFLWHGTNHTSAQNIISSGFNRSYCGQHGTAIGNGVYFATGANYSASPTYSRPNQQGEQCMFYSRVLTGVFTQGSSGLIEPPQRAGGSSFTRYDSVVNNISTPGMYVVFTDTAAYPDHLVTF